MPKVPFNEREELRKHLRKAQSSGHTSNSNDTSGNSTTMLLCQPHHGEPPYQREPASKGTAVTYKVEPCNRFRRCLPTQIVHQGPGGGWKETYYTCKYDFGISEGFGAGPPPVGMRVGVLVALALVVTIILQYRHGLFWRSKPRG